MRQFTNRASLAGMLLVVSHHLIRRPRPDLSVPAVSVCGPHLGPFPPFSAPPELGAPRATLLEPGLRQDAASLRLPPCNSVTEPPQRRPGGTGATRCAEPVLMVGSKRFRPGRLTAPTHSGTFGLLDLQEGC